MASRRDTDGGGGGVHDGLGAHGGDGGAGSVVWRRSQDRPEAVKYITTIMKYIIKLNE